MNEEDLTLRQVLRQVPELTLSPERQGRLRLVWDERLERPFLFKPSDVREVSLEESNRQNDELGAFATNFMVTQILRTRGMFLPPVRRIGGRKKVVIIGYGVGTDMAWIKEAILSGYQVVVIDVSEVACRHALGMLDKLWASIKESKKERVLPERPVVNWVEARSALLNPEESMNLDLREVEYWYMCRTLNVLSDRPGESLQSAKTILQIMGRSLSEDWNPEGRNSVVIIGPEKNRNPKWVPGTSTPLSRRQVISNLRFGAGQKIRITREEEHSYYTQTYTGIVVTAG